MKKKINLGTMLLKHNLIDQASLTECLNEAKKQGKRIGQVLIEKEYIDDSQLVDLLSQQLQIEVISLDKTTIPEELQNILPQIYCQQNELIPYKKEEDCLYIAMHDPLNIQAITDLSIKFSEKIIPKICKWSDLQDIFGTSSSHHAEQDDKSVDHLIDAIEQDMTDFLPTHSNIEQLSNDAPIIKLVNWIINEAIKKHASDIHIERYETKALIRYRIDGILYDMDSPPENIFTIIVSRIKLIAGMNIAENRLPQDGRITHSFKETKKEKEEEKKIDLRVSTIPSIHGEGIVLRILDHTTGLLDLEQLGLSEQILPIFKKSITASHGMVLMTGPTGSGKTTALYSSLNYIQSEQKKIITLEDPVEYRLDRINQLNINASIGFTFASALRHILRQDPDIIMVGEIRDNETATVAMRAALTGHFVLSTLHTNDSISTIIRLLNMDIEPYLVSSTLVAIIAQRLVRTLCQHCKTAKIISDKTLSTMKDLQKIFQNQRHIYEGEGCEKCMYSGYSGRTGIYEILEINKDVRSLITNKISSVELKEHLKKTGMSFLLDNGFEKVRQGITTIEEVFRVTQKESEEE